MSLDRRPGALARDLLRFAPVAQVGAPTRWLDPGLPVDTVMVRAVTVPAGIGLRAALRELWESGGDQLVVVDERRRPVGVFAGERVSSEWCPEPSERVGAPGEESDPEGWPVPVATPCRVDELMVPIRARLAAGATIAQACAVMASSGCARATVLSPSGRVVGIVTAGAVLEWVARSVVAARAVAGNEGPRLGA